ncbi:MAG: tetraprenyl-beta-curcumene synthase family protein, partial [Alicyclobacillus sp.]|nr:tetraprenyl-beta-curcumene synthase family protein [Alicyclobacillus sp.]
GYLDELVHRCQAALDELPGYPAVKPHVVWFVDRYCELQEHKHVDPALRSARLQAWWAPYRARFPGVEWWEFAAACGSTLGIFSLFATAVEDVPEAVASRMATGYFPWICGLHILLDYLIDLEEDRREGDFNFVRCYPSAAEARRRIRLFAERSLEETANLPDAPHLHRYVVQGLLAMYLSDRKAGFQQDVRPMRRVVCEWGPTAWAFFGACRVYRLLCRT